MWEIMIGSYLLTGLVTGFVLAESSKEELSEIESTSKSSAYAILVLCGTLAWPLIGAAFVLWRAKK